MQQVAIVNGFTLKRCLEIYCKKRGLQTRSEQRCGVCGALGHLGAALSGLMQSVCESRLRLPRVGSLQLQVREPSWSRQLVLRDF